MLEILISFSLHFLVLFNEYNTGDLEKFFISFFGLSVNEYYIGSCCMVDGGELETLTVDCSDISPDLSADGLGDDGEYELLIPPSFYDEKFAKGRANGEDYLTIQVRCGVYTVVHDASGGHRNHFTHCDGALLENKSSFVLGDPDKSVTISNSEGSVPPGALAYPRAKVYTVNYARRLRRRGNRSSWSAH